jgi:dinuclear metal center YbgI/SA1388 family protein
MQIKEIIEDLEAWAPPILQENYDNAGLIIGNQGAELSGVLVTLDVTEEVVEEAINKKCNLIVAHHPIIFKGLKRITGKNYVERTVIKAIKNDIAIYAIHTNLDNVKHGVNAKIAEKLGLSNLQILEPKSAVLMKLITFVPNEFAEQLKQALFAAGAGHIGNYDQCSFSIEGNGTFRAQNGTNPYVGKIGEQHQEIETRIEAIVPAYQIHKVVLALKEAHPYEEVAYDLVPLATHNNEVGSGMVGELPEPMNEQAFLAHLKKSLQIENVRYTSFSGDIKHVALCGGAGSFLIEAAKRSGAQAFVTADVKYHEFFDADQALMIADVGHYESEFFTKELIQQQILKKIPTFAVLLSEIKTNPIKYI